MSIETNTVSDELIARYRAALKAWRYVASVLTVKLITQRAYCDQFVNGFGPIICASNSTNNTVISSNDAYIAACILEQRLEK